MNRTNFRPGRRVRAALAVAAFAAAMTGSSTARAADTTWSGQTLYASFPITVPGGTYSVSGTCGISGGTGAASLYLTGGSAAADVTVTQTGVEGATVSCSGTAYFTYQSCIWFSCDTYYGQQGVGGSGGPYYVDQTAPVGLGYSVTGTSPNAAGWFRTPGTVTWSAFDPESGIAQCDARDFGSVDTASASLTGGCVNSAGLAATSTFTFKFDGTPPTLAPSVSPSVITLGGSATADPGASDAASLVKQASCGAIDTGTVGPHTLTCTATDNAGNQASADVAYTVAYGFGGFAAPVDSTVVNVVKAGRTVPLTFSVTDAGGAPVVDLTAVSVQATSLSCGSGDTVSLLSETATGGSGLQNLGGGQYQFNWATPKSYAGSCKTVSLNLGDGVAHDLQFQLK